MYVKLRVTCKTEKLIFGVCPVDDGTEVVDCLYTKPVTKPLLKPKGKGKEREAEAGVENVSCSLLEVGATATIVGKVVDWRDGRQVVAETVGECRITPRDLSRTAHVLAVSSLLSVLRRAQALDKDHQSTQDEVLSAFPCPAGPASCNAIIQTDLQQHHHPGPQYSTSGFAH